MNSICLPQAQAITKRHLLAEDPKTKSVVATDELSPFSTMIFASYIGAVSSVFYFAPSKISPDYRRTQVEDMNGAAAGVILAGGMVNMLFGMAWSPLITPEERVKLGPLSEGDINPEVIAFQKKGFLISHIINTAAIGAVASQSLREDRWSIVTIQAILPFVVDLSARHIFGSKAISPWTFSVLPKIENGRPVGTLSFNLNW